MPPIPLATFLAGSLLSLLLPVGVLIALVVWYVRSIARVDDTEPPPRWPENTP